MTRAVVNVATGGRYRLGATRLREAVVAHAGPVDLRFWDGGIPRQSPSHVSVPYAFKAYALKDAADLGADLLLWCDASILPLRSLEPLWERIERDGYWFSDNGYSNYTWTANSAYVDLFPRNCYEAVQWNALQVSGTNPITGEPATKGSYLDWCRWSNRSIHHVVATAFGLNVRHLKGRAFLDEYYRLATETRAFCGPWWNKASLEDSHKLNAAVCGPPDVRGHRHDQTAASVIAWRLGLELTQPPDILAYRGRETDATILCVDGNF
jgi:hypothetical protein